MAAPVSHLGLGPAPPAGYQVCGLSCPIHFLRPSCPASPSPLPLTPMCSGFWDQDNSMVSAAFQGKAGRKSEPPPGQF